MYEALKVWCVCVVVKCFSVSEALAVCVRCVCVVCVSVLTYT